MPQTDKLKYYAPFEEKLNVLTHAMGFGLAIIATVLLLIKAVNYGTYLHIVSFMVYGFAMILMYAASSTYHYFTEPTLRFRLKILDHSAIYLMIAGTYTPFTLVVLKGQIGWVLFTVSWTLACIGVTLKVYFTGRFRRISTIAYVLMGWVIVFAIEPLRNALPVNGVWWLMAGGVAYTVGAVLYSMQFIKFNHAIFHVFVLLGSFCHFMAIYRYILEV